MHLNPLLDRFVGQKAMKHLSRLAFFRKHRGRDEPCAKLRDKSRIAKMAGLRIRGYLGSGCFWRLAPSWQSSEESSLSPRVCLQLVCPQGPGPNPLKLLFASTMKNPNIHKFADTSPPENYHVPTENSLLKMQIWRLELPGPYRNARSEAAPSH